MTGWAVTRRGRVWAGAPGQPPKAYRSLDAATQALRRDADQGDIVALAWPTEDITGPALLVLTPGLLGHLRWQPIDHLLDALHDKVLREQ